MTTATVVQEARYILTELGNNNNKFWHIFRYGDHSVKTEWGRVGDSGQSKIFPHGSEAAAKKFFDGKIREKERKGYSPERTIAGSEVPSIVRVGSGQLAEIARSQIEGDDYTKKLIDYLVKVNIHNIEEANSNIKYNYSTGLFQTPLGIVTKDGIEEARKLVDDISDYVVRKAYSDPQLLVMVNQYLRIIPTDIGRRRIEPKTLFPDASAVTKQVNILDSLEASYMEATKPVDEPKEKVEQPRLFQVKLNLVQDSSTVDRVKQFYKSTKNGVHASYNLDVKTVYEVEIGGMKQAFERDGAKMSNIWELWHGTKASNLLSIMKGGFIIPRSGGSIAVTGRMFGDGLYFSDQSTKSLNYASGYWGGGRDNNCFMFLNDVAMGNYHVPRGSFSGGCRAGYDSTFAKGRESGVMNNEMIIYRTSQVNPKYLIEFSPGGR